MATLALGAAGAALGGALFPGAGLLGGALSGAAIGQAVGAIAGSYIDNALFGPSGQTRVVEGPRLKELQIQGSTEGAAVPRVYGRVRLAGQIIWATRFEEEIARTTEPARGGKGLGGGGGGSGTTRIEYRYYANFAVGLCEGPITRIGRVWADGKPLRLSRFTTRVYRGTETQNPDSLISAKQGSGEAPAYRGLAYVVFERMPLERFGNRIPQLAFEVSRAVDGFENRIKAVTVIPGATEFGYATQEVLRDTGPGTSAPENVHTHEDRPDWQVAIDDLEASLPNTTSVSLVVSWFGDDLRAGTCQLRPGVENVTKVTTPLAWSVAGHSRGTAYVVSQHDGRPAYGGTPSDQTVVAAIQDLKARGLAVTFSPFILMDVPSGNALPDPYGGAAQAPYPWRGRITVHPAPGQPGSPDKTAAAAADIAAFVGAAQVAHFSVAGGAVAYSGPAEWSYRRMVLHHAHLCKAAGGVDAFLIGSELRGLTNVRASASAYPFVAALVQIAADVKTVLGAATKVVYAADWSEYFGHQPPDGSGDVFFHLDPLWASASIDAIGIDVYWPLSDWRDGETHTDRLTGVEQPHDLGYLRGNIFGGEGYDWYYASDADRDVQIRSTITDGAYNKPWVYRFKDIRSWWQNAHYNRPGGVESGTPTAWVPGSKPIWFTEFGCPAVDKGSNQPNVFIDPKSAESLLPYYSRGVRDDFIQRRYIEALASFFDLADPDYVAGSNPSSTVYTGTMVDPARLYVYTWDARPHPAFPLSTATWSDGANWTSGHWLTGRLAGGSLAGIVAAILTENGFTRFSVAGLTGSLDGYVIDRVMPAREALQPLELAFAFDTIEQSGIVRFAHRGRKTPVASFAPDLLVERKPADDLYRVTRGQETELPAVARVGFIDGGKDYRQGIAEARHTTTRSERVSTAELPIVMASGRALEITERWLRDAWTARERLRLALPPSRLALEPSDVIELDDAGSLQRFRITEIADTLDRQVEALSLDPGVFEPAAADDVPGGVDVPSAFGKPVAVYLDLPQITGTEPPPVGYVAAFMQPWPGGVAFHRSADVAGFVLDTVVAGQAVMGTTTSLLGAGPAGRFDRGNALEVSLFGGSLQSVSELQLLGGANTGAIETAPGVWEILQFRIAELIAPSQYLLSDLLRGQLGTETAMTTALAPGARFVLLDAAVAATGLARDEAGLTLNWRAGAAPLDIGHASFVPASVTFRGFGYRPLSPVHVRGVRDGGGDLAISWIRRTRVGGDSWDGIEVPLAEETERYEVDVLDGAIVKRTLASATSSVLYTAAAQNADFGSLPASVALRVTQVSPSFGRGAARAAVV